MDLSNCIAAVDKITQSLMNTQNAKPNRLIINAASRLVPSNINLEEITKHKIPIKDRSQQEDEDEDEELYLSNSDSSSPPVYASSSSSSESELEVKSKKKKKKKTQPSRKRKHKAKKQKKKKWKMYDSEGYTDSDDEEDANLAAMRKPPVVLRPIGLLPRKQARRQRIFELKNSIMRRTGQSWRCKYCDTGDGKVDGLSSGNMRTVYAMEHDLRWSMTKPQFIDTIVSKYNELVYEENLINNPTEQVPKLTPEEYELHLYECFEKRDIISVLWNTNDDIQEQIEYISQTASLMQNPDNGSIVVDNKTYRTVSHLYAHMTKNMKMIDEMKRREELQHEKEKSKRAKQQERAGAGFYGR